jgi:hypothetical protein
LVFGEAITNFLTLIKSNVRSVSIKAERLVYIQEAKERYLHGLPSLLKDNQWLS